MRALLLAFLFLVAICDKQYDAARAQNNSDCLSSDGTEDICEKARYLKSYQDRVLPKQTRPELTVVSVTANGRRLSYVGLVNRSKDEQVAIYARIGKTLADAASEVQLSTTKSVCDDTESLGKFVRSRGEIQYTFYSKENIELFTALVTNCP